MKRLSHCFAAFGFHNYLSRPFSEKCDVQLLNRLTLEQSKSEKCEMVSSLILWAITIPHFEQICYHLIPKMHVSNT